MKRINWLHFWRKVHVIKMLSGGYCVCCSYETESCSVEWSNGK